MLIEGFGGRGEKQNQMKRFFEGEKEDEFGGNGIYTKFICVQDVMGKLNADPKCVN